MNTKTNNPTPETKREWEIIKKEFFSNTESFLTKYQAMGIWDTFEKILSTQKELARQSALEEVKEALYGDDLTKLTKILNEDNN